MEVRSSERVRKLVTQKWPVEACPLMRSPRALISMMARSKCSNQEPDTLMREPAHRQLGKIHLQHTSRTRYIRVNLDEMGISHHVGFPPESDRTADMAGRQLRAKPGHLARSVSPIIYSGTSGLMISSPFIEILTMSFPSIFIFIRSSILIWLFS